LEASQTEQPKEFKLSFQYQPKQKALFQYVSRNGGMYLQLKAPQCLEVGGIRSGKTNGKLVYGIENYCLKYKHCDMLVLRRTISELKSGAIEDFFKFFPKDSGWYTYNHTERVATFANGSRLVFGGCVRAGTLINTSCGLVPIEHVTTSDLALTRKGYKRVLWSGQTGTKPTIRVENTWLTDSHPVYRNGEFIPARKVQQAITEAYPPAPVYDLTIEGEHEYFANGLLVHNCENLLEKDIEKYLGQSYPFILVDECGQFSDYAWNLLYSRNLVNVQCEPDDYGNYPIPAIVGCTNPTGAYWNYYHTVFVKQEPWDRSEGMKRAKDGRWFVERSGEMVCVYDPKNYAFNHSTVLDNAEYIKRQPNIVAKLRAMPEALMKKFLQGYMDTVEGPYFDCFNEEYHVIDLRTEPDAIQWQDWQLVWVGHDWGVGHWSAAYFFTKAMCKVTLPNGGEDWKLKTVCFQEVAPESTGYSNVEFADMLNAKAHYPRLPESHGQFERISGKRCKVSTIYFSHEKFSRVMEKHSPSDEYSQLMRARGLPPVSRATMDRVGSAGFMYNELKLGRLVILKTCPGIIMAIPSLQRNKDNLDDVLKVDTKADDRYDAFRYGLYGGLSAKGKPQSEKDKEYASTITDPIAKHFYLRKAAFAKRDEGKPFKQEERPYWESKVIQ